MSESSASTACSKASESSGESGAGPRAAPAQPRVLGTKSSRPCPSHGSSSEDHSTSGIKAKREPPGLHSSSDRWQAAVVRNRARNANGKYRGSSADGNGGRHLVRGSHPRASQEPTGQAGLCHTQQNGSKMGARSAAGPESAPPSMVPPRLAVPSARGLQNALLSSQAEANPCPNPVLRWRKLHQRLMWAANES